MSFSSGFKDGFTYYMSLVDQERKDKLAESSIQTDELRRESYQSTIDFNQERLKLSQTTPGELDAIPPEERSFSQIELISKRKSDAFALDKAELDLDTSDVNNQAAQANLNNTLATIEDENDKKAVLTIMNINKRLASGKINETVAASILEEPLMVLKENGVYDFTKYGDPEYVKGWERIAPKLESGDFISIAENDSDVLSKIFSEPLRVFTGKTFVNEDGRKGTIQSVALSGDFDPIQNTANALVGGNFMVQYEGDDEPTEVFSYLPDNAKSAKEIVQDKSSGDAKVVSVADIVDRVSAEKEFMMYAINNPSVMNTIIEAGKGAVNYTGNPDIVEKMTKTHFNLKQAGETHIGTVESSANKARVEAQKNFGDPESAYLGVYLMSEPEIAGDFIESVPGEFEGDVSYQLREGQSLDLMKDKMVEKYANPQKIYAQVADAYSTYEELEDITGRKPFYFHKGEHYKFDTKKDELDAKLTLRVDDYNNKKTQAAEAYESVYGVGSFETISDEQYVSFMTAYLNELGR